MPSRWVTAGLILTVLSLLGSAILISQVATNNNKNSETTATCPIRQYATGENNSGSFLCGSASNTNYLTSAITTLSPFCPDVYIIQNQSNVVSAQKCSTGQIQFGGTGNAGGVSGTNFSAVFNAASLAAIKVFGGTIYITCGWYSALTSILLYEGVNIDGCGLGFGVNKTGTLLITSGNYPLVNISSFHETHPALISTISNVLLRGSNNSALTLNNGIYENNSHTFDLYIHNIVIESFYNGIYDQAGSKTRIEQSTIEDNLNDGIIVPSNTFLLTCIDCYVRNNGNIGILLNGAQTGQIIGCQFILNVKQGLMFERFGTPNKFNIATGNFFDSNGGSSNLEIDGSALNVTVTGNTFMNETNAVPTNDISMFSGGGGSIVGNTFAKGSSSGAVISFGGQTNRSIVSNNLGYNPFGVRANFVFPQGGGTGGNWISPIGTTSTLTASTTYTISDIPVLILVQTIGLSTISINGGASITPTIGETYYLYPGQTINFGAFVTTPPTLQVIFS